MLDVIMKNVKNYFDDLWYVWSRIALGCAVLAVVAGCLFVLFMIVMRLDLYLTEEYGARHSYYSDPAVDNGAKE